MRKKNYIAVFTVLVFCLVSCGEAGSKAAGFSNILTLTDSAFPVLRSVQAVSRDSVELEFDEDVFADPDAFYPCSSSISGRILTLYPPQEIKPGSSVRLDGTVRDGAGNSTTFSVTVWGYNQDPAVMRINEFTTKGTRTQPDRTELEVLRGGNLAGMTLFDGIPGNFRSVCILPDEDVGTGDYVVVWWCDELPSGVKFHDGRVVNVCAGGGLSENNGVLCLAVSPAQGAGVQDTVVYSAGESAQFEGFGTKEVFERVTKAREEGLWDGESVYSAWSTSTRSMALGSDGRWYTTVQGGASFGSANTAEEYIGVKQ